MVLTKQEKRIPSIYVPREVVRELRSLFSSYQLTVRELVMTKNRIRSLLTEYGLAEALPEGKLTGCAMKELVEIHRFPVFIQTPLEAFTSIVVTLEESIVKLEETILSVGSVFEKEIELLTSIRGVSVFIALAIMADIGDIKRFQNAKSLCSYLRTAPKVEASNKTVKIGHINRRSRSLTLGLLLQAFNHFLDGSERINDFYYRKKKGKGSGKARIAVARKMITAIYMMLTNQEYYRFREEEKHKEKLEKYYRFLKKIA